jgi:hypothetical protein
MILAEGVPDLMQRLSRPPNASDLRTRRFSR